MLASLSNRTRSLDGRSLSRCRPSCGVHSLEGRFAVPAPLELEEAVRPGDHDQAVPESSGSFTARGRCDHGAEQVDQYLSLLLYLARPEADITNALRPSVRPVKPWWPMRETPVWLVGYADR